jgi:hypothetical protein
MAKDGIWLEVAAVQYDSAEGCTVQLKGDKEEKEPVWWPVDPIAGKSAVDTYKDILGEIDRKRLVFAKLSYVTSSAPPAGPPKTELHCTVLRFRLVDSVNR